MEGPDFLESMGEGAYHSDEENRRSDREPYPDEVWEKEFREEEELP